MSVIFVLIGVSMLVALCFLFGFLWAVKKGQYDDSYSPSVRILFDDQEEDEKEQTTTQEKDTIKQKTDKN